MKRFKNILCVVEPDKEWRSAAERAVQLAETNHAQLTIIAVTPTVTAGIGMPEGGPISAELQAAVTDNLHQKLEALAEPYRQRIKIGTKVLVGIPFLEISRAVLKNNYDMVIKSPESLEWLERLLGGDDMHLLRKCPCPVWMIKPQTKASYHRVLAAVDVNTNYPLAERETRQALNEVIISIAGNLAVSDFSELHIVHAWEAIGESAMRHGILSRPNDEVDSYVERVQAQHTRNLHELVNEETLNWGADAWDFLKPQLHMLKGSARKEIPALAKRLNIDCIVMGTIARTGIRGFIMGNTAETILDQIDCSVLAIKPPGFATPIMLED